MNEIESQIRALLRSCVGDDRPIGVIKCEAGDGVAGFTGEIETGREIRRKQDATRLLEAARGRRPDFSELLLQLRDASRQHALGPFYHCNIEFNESTILFEYFWEGKPFRSIRDLEPALGGGVPSYVFNQRFDSALVEELTDFDVNNCLFFYVPMRFKAGKTVSDSLLEVFATLEWQSDVNNGSMNQYFARDHEPMTALPRSKLYDKTLKGLLRIGLTEAARIFTDSVALYAHFYPRVEVARAELNIAAVPKQEQSNVMGSYYEMESALDAARVKYIREHIRELEQN